MHPPPWNLLERPEGVSVPRLCGALVRGRPESWPSPAAPRDETSLTSCRTWPCHRR